MPVEREQITVEYKFRDALGTETREFWTTPGGPVIHRENGFVYVIKSGGDGEFGASERFGDWDLAWGDVHRAVIGDVDVPVGGCTGMIGCFRVIWYSDHRNNDQKREVRGGDGWVFAVEFGEQNRAYTILAYGQTSAESSQYATIQLPIFTNNEMTPAALTKPEIEAALTRKYRPGKAE